ncbi:hypothetical protein AVEN_270789-1 [Araneus ventricosus]|uniref:Uncharacterized protein n=1 Tax=Araneus ventricosus TaxID=182803 RepID=A0A4Y2HZM3_ARAVE|nr:hypothetical protein AVEN_270789-1 [Araneus ventricosus]
MTLDLSVLFFLRLSCLILGEVLTSFGDKCHTSTFMWKIHAFQPLRVQRSLSVRLATVLSLTGTDSQAFLTPNIQYVHNWLFNLFPADRRPNIVTQILFFFICFIFCSFVGYPLLVLLSFFLFCSYYPYANSVFLCYFFFSWMKPKFVSFLHEETQQSQEPQPRGESDFAHEMNIPELDQPEDALRNRRSQEVATRPSSFITESLEGTHGMIIPGLDQAEIWRYRQTQEVIPEQSRKFDHNHQVPENLSQVPEDSSSEDLSDTEDPLWDPRHLTHMLRPSYLAHIFQPSPLGDVASLSSKSTSVSGSSKSTVRKKRQRPKVVDFHKPKRRKKKPTAPSQ